MPRHLGRGRPGPGRPSKRLGIHALEGKALAIASAMVKPAPANRNGAPASAGAEDIREGWRPTSFDEAVRRAGVTRRPVHHRLAERLP